MVNLYFNQGVPKVNIEIDVFKGQSAVAEDFNRARVFLWLVSEYDKTLLSCVASNGKITGSFVQGDDFTLEAGVYSIKAIWIKDDKREELVRPYDQHKEGTKMCMTEVKNAFVITSYSEDKTHGAEAEINLKYEARVATYGYDGLSAYEIACIYWPNNTALSEKEWVKIRAAEIETNQIKDKAITTAKIADEAVTTAKINDGAVTTAKIADGNVVTQKIADGNVTTAKIADSNVTTQKIADGNVITSKIADGAVTTGKIKDANVVTAKIADAAVITDKLANGAVTTEKIVDSNVTTSKIDNGAVTETKIKDDAVTNEKIADGAVNTDQIEDGAVTTEKIKDEAVTEDKIGTGEVTTSKIKDDAVTTEKIKDGEVSTDNIAAGAVTEDKIKYGAVTETKIGNGAVTKDKIKDGDVTTGKIADGSVTTGKIADGAVTMAKLADGAITDDKIADGALSTFETEQSERLTDLAQKVGEMEYDVEGVRQQVEGYHPIVINNSGTINNAADEEDLHADTTTGLISLANRSSLNGMGYVILRKDKTFAEQVKQANTIYEIRYDFDLNGAKVTIPENCTLNFVGGKVYTSTGDNSSCNILYQNTYLQGDVNIEVAAKSGSHIRNERYCIDWFGLKNRQETNPAYDWVVAFEHLQKYGGTLYFTPSKDYYLNNRCIAEQQTVNSNSLCIIEGNGATIHFCGSRDSVTKTMIWLNGSKNANEKVVSSITISGLNIDGSQDNGGFRPTSGKYNVKGLYCESFQNVSIKNCKISDLYGTGIDVRGKGADEQIANVEITNNILSNVGNCYGEGQSAGGVGIHVNRCHAIISNNQIINNFLDGNVDVDGNIHRRNWIGINAGENMARNLVVENNTIYGYDRAIHLEVVSPRYQQSIRNNMIYGCDNGIVLWNINSNVDIEGNTIYGKDIDTEHSYISSSLSQMFNTAIYIVGPIDLGICNIKKNYIKSFENSKSLSFVYNSSVFTLTNTNLPNEEGKRVLPTFRNINVEDNVYYNDFGSANILPLSVAFKNLNNNVIEAPLATCHITFSAEWSFTEFKTCKNNTIRVKNLYIGSNVITFIGFGSGKGKYCGIIADNDITAEKVSFAGLNYKVENNHFEDCVLSSLGIRRRMMFDALAHPSLLILQNTFDNCTYDNSKSICQGNYLNRNIELNNDKTQVVSRKLFGKDTYTFIEYIENANETTSVYCFYPASFNSAGTRYDEEFIGHVRGYFAKGSNVFVGQTKKNYVNSTDGWYALAGWYPNAKIMYNDVINVNGYIYQNVTPTDRAKSGDTKPTFPSSGSVRDNDIVWEVVGSGDVDGAKSWEANTIYEFGELLTENNKVYIARMRDCQTGAEQPTFPTATGSTIRDGSITWMCKGECISFSEEA